MGCALGYILGAIDWQKTVLNIIGDDTEILSIFAAIILVVSLISTLFSLKGWCS